MRENWKGKDIAVISGFIIILETISYISWDFFALSFSHISKRELSLLYILFIRLLDITFLALYLKMMKKGWRSCLGFTSDECKDHIKYGLILSIAFGIAAFGVYAAIYIYASVDLIPYLFKPRAIPPSMNYIALYILAAVIVSPFIEEIVFRGILYPFFRQHSNIIVSLLLNAALFTIAHGITNKLFIIQLTGGFIFAYIYEKRGSIIPSYIVHSIGNLALFLISL